MLLLALDTILTLLSLVWPEIKCQMQNISSLHPQCKHFLIPPAGPEAGIEWDRWKVLR